MGDGFILVAKSDKLKKPDAIQPTALSVSGGGKPKLQGNEQEGKKKPKKEFSDKSLKMGLYHLKEGTPAIKALPDKSTRKDSISVCLDFLPQKEVQHAPSAVQEWQALYQLEECTQQQQSHFAKHMDRTGLMWLNAETFKKHKILIAPKCIHLLGNANGPKQNKRT
jgi:hypothetical protein